MMRLIKKINAFISVNEFEWMNVEEYLEADCQSHETIMDINAQPQEIIDHVVEGEEEDEADEYDIIGETPKISPKEAIEGLKKSIEFVEQSGDASMEINLLHIYNLITKIESQQRKGQNSTKHITLDSYLKK